MLLIFVYIIIVHNFIDFQFVIEIFSNFQILICLLILFITFLCINVNAYFDVLISVVKMQFEIY